MIITILAEPRSGSTNLTNWFYFNVNFTTLFEPLNPLSKWYQKGISINDYEYKTPYLLIKEIYYPDKDWSELINFSNKIIILFRENYLEQLESFINSVTTNNWDSSYIYRPINNDFVHEKKEYFKKLKSEFKEKYRDNPNLFKISYEELYYKNGIEKLINFIDLDCVKNENFPYGKKYRIYVDNTKSII